MSSTSTQLYLSSPATQPLHVCYQRPRDPTHQVFKGRAAVSASSYHRHPAPCGNVLRALPLPADLPRGPSCVSGPSRRQGPAKTPLEKSPYWGLPMNSEPASIALYYDYCLSVFPTRSWAPRHGPICHPPHLARISTCRLNSSDYSALRATGGRTQYSRNTMKKVTFKKELFTFADFFQLQIQSLPSGAHRQGGSRRKQRLERKHALQWRGRGAGHGGAGGQTPTLQSEQRRP